MLIADAGSARPVRAACDGGDGSARLAARCQLPHRHPGPATTGLALLRPPAPAEMPAGAHALPMC